MRGDHPSWGQAVDLFILSRYWLSSSLSPGLYRLAVSILPHNAVAINHNGAYGEAGLPEWGVDAN